MTWSRSDLLAGKLYWLLEITYAGKTYRLSTDTFTVTTDDGEDLLFVDALDGIDWEEALASFAAAPEQRSVPFREVVLPATDVAELVSLGHDLAAATGELSQWLEGSTYEQRRILLQGRVVEPEYGAEGEPISFSLEANPWEDRSVIIPPGALVDSESWPNHDESAYGRAYPLVLGKPGAGGFFDRIKATPGLQVDDSGGAEVLLIAGHTVEASNVSVRKVGNTLWDTVGVSETTDGRGRVVATADISGALNNPPTAGAQYEVAWGYSGLGGGLEDEDRLITGAGDVLRYALARTTMPIDIGRVESAIQDLQRFRIAAYIDDPAMGWWEWVQRQLLPILPVSIVAGASGLYPIVWRWWATEDDAVAHIDTSLGKAERAGRVEYTPRSEIANEIRVRYGIEDDTGDYKRMVTVHGNTDTETPTGDDLYLDHLCRVSVSRYGVAVVVVETDVVYERATATAIASWMARARALPSRVITYDADRAEYGHLEPGDAVLLTDADVHITNQLCLVEAISEDDGRWLQLQLRTIEGQERD